MKKNGFYQGFLMIALVWVCSMGISAMNPKNYVYDTKMDGEKIVSKTIFVEDGGYLLKEICYEFDYNDAGKVTEKRALKWSNSTNKWEPTFRITYKYDADQIVTEYCVWDKKKKSYCMNPQLIVMSYDDYETIFS